MSLPGHERANGRRRAREYLLVRHGGRLVPVRVGEIAWIAAAGNQVELHLAGEAIRARCSLRAVEAALDPERFVRIHRSAIVNLARVVELAPRFAGDYAVHLDDGTELRLSRRYRRDLEARFGIA